MIRLLILLTLPEKIRMQYVTERTYSWCCDNFLIGETGVAERLHEFPQKIVELD